MHIQFITEDNQKLFFTNFVPIPKIGKKIKFKFLDNGDKIIEYKVIDVLYNVRKLSASLSYGEIEIATVTLKPVLN